MQYLPPLCLKRVMLLLMRAVMNSEKFLEM